MNFGIIILRKINYDMIFMNFGIIILRKINYDMIFSAVLKNRIKVNFYQFSEKWEPGKMKGLRLKKWVTQITTPTARNR